MTRRKAVQPDRTQIGHRTFHCNNPSCPGRAWPDGTPRLLEQSHFTIDGLCLGRFRVVPWPNGLGHDVYQDSLFVGEVQDDPVQSGVRVRTVDETGAPQRVLALPGKVEPVAAVLRCRREGHPVNPEN
jgi:hypothetical protein